jgi:hypothetical protein
VPRDKRVADDMLRDEDEDDDDASRSRWTCGCTESSSRLGPASPEAELDKTRERAGERPSSRRAGAKRRSPIGRSVQAKATVARGHRSTRSHDSPMTDPTSFEIRSNETGASYVARRIRGADLIPTTWRTATGTPPSCADP